MEIESTIKKIKEELKHTDNDMRQYQTKKNDLQKELISCYKKKLLPLVGKCFINGDVIFTIIGLPETSYIGNDLHMNPYQLPALIIHLKSYKEFIAGFADIDTIFSKVVDKEDLSCFEYVEIPKELFKKLARDACEFTLTRYLDEEF